MPVAKCELVPPTGRIKDPERAGLGPEANRESVSKQTGSTERAS